MADMAAFGNSDRTTDAERRTCVIRAKKRALEIQDALKLLDEEQLHEQLHELDEESDRINDENTDNSNVPSVVRDKPTPFLPFACSDCHKAYKSKQGLNLHNVRIHSKQYPFNCNEPECNKGFIQKMLLDEHRVREHNYLGVRRCTLCAYVAKSRYQIRRHEAYHQGRRYGCSQCPKEYLSKASLCLHVQRKHSNPNAFKCDECERSFSIKADLNRHKMNHKPKEQRTHMCEYCPYRTNESSNLTRHRNIFHSTNLCQVCGEIIHGKDEKNNHLQISPQCNTNAGNKKREIIWNTV